MKVLQKLLGLCLSSWLLLVPGVIYAQTDQSAGESAPQVVKHTHDRPTR